MQIGIDLIKKEREMQITKHDHIIGYVVISYKKSNYQMQHVLEIIELIESYKNYEIW